LAYIADGHVAECLVVDRESTVTGVNGVTLSQSSTPGMVSVGVELDAANGDRFRTMSSTNDVARMALLVDGKIVSSPKALVPGCCDSLGFELPHDQATRFAESFGASPVVETTTPPDTSPAAELDQRASELCIAYGKAHLSSDYQFEGVFDSGSDPICSMVLLGPNSAACTGNESTPPCLITLRVRPDGSIEQTN
jgi:hypothetical protein